MRWNLLKTLLCLALVTALAAPAAAQDWAGRGRANGQVVDEKGDPVAGAKVTLHRPGQPDAGPEPETTEGDGRWAFGGVGGGGWTVVVEKEGYLTSEGTIRVNEFAPAAPIKIELQRDAFSGIQTGQELIEQGRYAEARAHFEQVLPEMEPHQQAQLRALIGTTYFEEGNFEAARQAYEQGLPGLEADEQLGVHLRLGDAYLRLDRFAEARKAYEAALQGLPGEGRAQVLLAIARTHDLEGDRSQAIADVERVLEQEPGNVQALQLIADLLGREGREEEAQTYLDRVPESEEIPVDILLNQGIRFYNDENLDRALENFERVIRRQPETADAYYYRGLVHLRNDDNAAALADFEKHLELDPDSQYAADARQFVEYLKSE